MIIAVDFDGILCDDEFPNIGSPNYSMISYVRKLIDRGHEVVLWTSRVDERLEEAVSWCHDYGLHFCAVNDNAPSNKSKYSKEYSVEPRKVYADVYLEDHCPWFHKLAMENKYNGVSPIEVLINRTETMISAIDEEETNHE